MMVAPAWCSAAVLLVAAVAHAAPQCAEYVRRGYCHEEKFATYLSRHCPNACSGAASASAVEEDAACANWAAEGYCTHPQFVRARATIEPPAA